MQKKVLESHIQAAIKKYLQFTGWFVYRNHQSLGSHKGLADLTAIKKGVVIWIEVKKPNGTQSEYQIKFQEHIESSGGYYMVARSVEDVMQYISSVCNSKSEPNLL